MWNFKNLYGSGTITELPTLQCLIIITEGLKYSPDIGQAVAIFVYLTKFIHRTLKLTVETKSMILLVSSSSKVVMSKPPMSTRVKIPHLLLTMSAQVNPVYKWVPANVLESKVADMILTHHALSFH